MSLLSVLFPLLLRQGSTYILHFTPPPPLLGRVRGGDVAERAEGEKKENLLTQKLEQNDQKCVYFYTFANICKGKKI